jgi:DoxX
MIDVFDRAAAHAPHAYAPRIEPTVRPDPLPHHHRGDKHLHRPMAVLVLLPLRLFLAAGWLRAGIEKVIEPKWRTGQALRKFLVDQHDSALPFFRPAMDHPIAPAAVPVAIVVMVTQVACGLAIATGKQLRLALSTEARLGVVPLTDEAL